MLCSIAGADIAEGAAEGTFFTICQGDHSSAEQSPSTAQLKGQGLTQCWGEHQMLAGALMLDALSGDTGTVVRYIH